MRGRLAGALAGALLASACALRPSYVSTPGPHDVLAEEGIQRARLARAALEAGRVEEARSTLAALAAEFPRSLPVAILLQEVELRLLASGEGLRGLAPATDEESARAELFEEALARAEGAPSLMSWVLAARLAPDPARTRDLLAKAAELEPESVWVPYGRAWSLYVERSFPRARSAIRGALRRDPGHLPTLRLQASLLASAGEVGEAVRALSIWIERARESPFVEPAAVAEAEVDLASLLVRDGEPETALAILDAAERGSLAVPARVELVRAAAYAEADEPELALQASERAAELDPDDPLCLVQEALLWHERPGGREHEREAWEELLARTDRTAGEGAGEKGAPPLDFTTLLIRLQARTRLERLTRAQERAEAARERDPREVRP